MTNIIRKAVIPAAGLGTRFLPATKVVPKELLPIVDIPTIQYIVDEVVKAGLETVVLITARGKGAIEDYLDLAPELERQLEKAGKTDLLERLYSASPDIEIVSVRQKVPKGLGHAILCAKEVIQNEPFAVLLGDDIVDSEVPCIKQMMDVYTEFQKPVVAIMEVADEDVSKFGICGGKKIRDRILSLDAMVEKPNKSQAPSNLAIVGRYILPAEIFSYLERVTPGALGEIQLTDAMEKFMKDKGFIGYQFTGKRYDAGDKFGFIQANIAYAMKRPDIAPKLREYLKSI